MATPLSQAERSAVTHAPKAGAAAQTIGNQVVRPGVVHADPASALSSLPDPLLAMLAFLLTCVLALGGRAIHKGIRGRPTA